MQNVNIVSFIGLGFGHRDLILGYAKEWTTGEAGKTMPDLRSVTYLVGVNTIGSGLIKGAKAAFMNRHIQATTRVIVGVPFLNSNEFAGLFHRGTLPKDLGGDASTGEDGHCCLGVPQPCLADEGGEEVITPSTGLPADDEQQQWPLI